MRKIKSDSRHTWTLEASGASENEEWMLESEVSSLHPQPWSCWWTVVSADPAESLTQLWSRGTLQFEMKEEQKDTVHDFDYIPYIYLRYF